MRAIFLSLVCIFCCGFINVANADTDMSADAAASTDSLVFYKSQLYKDLDSGNILDGSFDKQVEISIAQTQLKLAQAYINQGDRKLAIILGVLARKTMQRALGNPYDPAMIPIYSTLVQLYNSQVDTDEPNTNQADAEQAKAYREAIDHIHAQ